LNHIPFIASMVTKSIKNSSGAYLDALAEWGWWP
jgi:hypothetical protein